MRNFLQVLAIQQLNCQHLYILQISTHVGSVIGVGQMLANQLTLYVVSILYLEYFIVFPERKNMYDILFT